MKITILKYGNLDMVIYLSYRINMVMCNMVIFLEIIGNMVMCRIVILLDDFFFIFLEKDKPLRAIVGIVLHLQRVQNIEENYKVAYN